MRKRTKRNGDGGLQQLLQPNNINEAWQWLKARRSQYPADDGVWHLRFHQDILLPNIIQSIQNNTFSFSPPQRIHKKDGTAMVVWSATDVWVQKMLAQILQTQLPMHKACTHIKGHGGAKQSVNRIKQWISSGTYPFVCRTDIRGYDANINKHQLVEQLAQYIHDPIILNLLAQYIYYTVEYGGTFHTPSKGICRGSPLSPLMAGFQLFCMDEHFSQQKHLRYQRYMDDFLILCKTRWHLKKAVKELNQFFNHFGFEQHPDKTFIGRTNKGFDWLGFQLNHTGIVGVSVRLLENHKLQLRQLYEQARKQKISQQQHFPLAYKSLYL
ncbi:MAG: reverse transcriptase domain-containing protein [Mariprofundaceae bacterium]|nr:reverse transcriptase domain-containing protein [Mariprofundaceae bacterium]